MIDLESAVLSAWYCSRPEIRRLRATRDTEGLHVLVELEPAQDSNEINPAWWANRHDWADELSWHMGATVRLVHANERFADFDASGGTLVTDLAWRDPSTQ